MKKTAVILFLLLALGVFLPSTALAYEPFEIVQYDVTIDVNENNTLDIVENIEINYFEPRHGIILNIPKRGELLRDINGVWTSTPYRSKIDVQDVVDHKYKVSSTSDSVDIKIGDAKIEVEGINQYSIMYSVDLGDDGIELFDDFYYNVIGNGWEVTIKKANITINMPKDFDYEKLECYSGYDDYYNLIHYETNKKGNSLFIDIIDEIPPYYGFTVRLELPEGYFYGERVPLDLTPFAYIISATLVLLSLIIFTLFGKDKKIKPYLCYTPPKDMTPTELGYIVDGVVDNKDVTSLIVYWASKGYLTIEEQDDSSLTFTKLKQAGEEFKEFETYMFNKLFDDEKTVNTQSLENSFYSTTFKVKQKVAELYASEGKSIYTQTSKNYRVLLFFFMPLPVILSSISTYLYNSEIWIFSSLLAITLLLCIFLPLKKLISYRYSRRAAGNIIRLLLIIAGLTIVFFILFALTLDKIILSFFVTCASFIIGFCAAFMNKRTDFAIANIEQILGLKQHIYISEKDQLTIQMQNNPEYFYNILPYAYVLGISDKWSKEFESMNISQPSWYSSRSYSLFTTTSFNRSINTSLNSIQRSISSTPSSSGSSGSSGGFSGGGSGGSSGSSW